MAELAASWAAALWPCAACMCTGQVMLPQHGDALPCVGNK